MYDPECSGLTNLDKIPPVAPARQSISISSARRSLAVGNVPRLTGREAMAPMNRDATLPASQRMPAPVKGFGCRSVMIYPLVLGAGVRKPPSKEPASAVRRLSPSAFLACRGPLIFPYKKTRDSPSVKPANKSLFRSIKRRRGDRRTGGQILTAAIARDAFQAQGSKELGSLALVLPEMMRWRTSRR